MRNPFVPCVGGILSADIAVPEHEREVLFYSRVLTTGETSLWREDLMNNRGMPSSAWARAPRSMQIFHFNGCRTLRRQGEPMETSPMRSSRIRWGRTLCWRRGKDIYPVVVHRSRSQMTEPRSTASSEA